MARRQLGHGRGGRMKIETDTVEVRSGVRHGRTLGSPIALLVANRDYANWEERMNPWPVEGFEPDEVHLPRPGPRRPRRRPEIRPHRHPQRPRAGQRPRDRRPRRRRLDRPRLPHARSGSDPQPRAPDRLGPGAASAPTSKPAGLRRRRRGPGPLPRPGGERGDGRGDQPPAQGEREPRRQLRGARLRARPRARLPHLLGRPPRRPPGRRRRLDPVGQGRRDRRSLGRRRPPRLGGPRRDLLVGGATATSARPTTPAASRAG